MGWLGSDGLCVDEETEVPGRKWFPGHCNSRGVPPSDRPPQCSADSRLKRTGALTSFPRAVCTPVCRAGQGSPAMAQTSCKQQALRG